MGSAYELARSAVATLSFPRHQLACVGAAEGLATVVVVQPAELTDALDFAVSDAAITGILVQPGNSQSLLRACIQEDDHSIADGCAGLCHIVRCNQWHLVQPGRVATRRIHDTEDASQKHSQLTYEA